MQALGYNVSGSNNTGVGVFALEQTTASYNTAVGVWAGRNVNTGTGNSFFGYFSGTSIQTGSYNSFFGHNIFNSGVGSLTGSNNTAVGANIFNMGSGSYNTVIGANVSVPTIDSNIIIADGRGNQRIRILSSGNTFLGYNSFTDAGYKLDVNGTLRAQSKVQVGSTLNMDENANGYNYLTSTRASALWLSSAGEIWLSPTSGGYTKVFDNFLVG